MLMIVFFNWPYSALYFVVAASKSSLVISALPIPGSLSCAKEKSERKKDANTNDSCLVFNFVEGDYFKLSATK